MISVDQAMTDILDNTCPNEILDDRWYRFIIETCCVCWMIEARLTNSDESDPRKWEIRSMKIYEED